MSAPTVVFDLLGCRSLEWAHLFQQAYEHMAAFGGERIVGDEIYVNGMRGLNAYLKG